MITYIDPSDIKDDIDRISNNQADDIKNDLDRLVSEYEDHISDLESDNADLEGRIDELEEELDKNVLGTLEAYVSSMLQSFKGHEPSLGEVISLKEDLEKLLTTKYNISLGNL